MKKVLILLGVAVVASACGEWVDPAAATVGDARIDADEVSGYVTSFERSRGFEEQQPQAPGDNPRTTLRRYEQHILSLLIQEQVVRAEANRLDIEATEDEVDAALEEQKARYGSEKEFREAYASLGETLEIVRNRLEVSVLERKLRTEVTGEFTPTEQEVREYYEQRKADYTRTGLQHILVDEQALARRLHRKLQAATPSDVEGLFARYVRKYSQDAETKDEKGDLGLLPAGQYPPEWDDIEVGGLAEPIQTERGWHVVRIRTRGVTPLEQVRTSIEQALAGQAAEEAWSRYLRELYEKVEVNPRYGRLDLQTQTVVNFDDGARPGVGTPDDSLQR